MLENKIKETGNKIFSKLFLNIWLLKVIFLFQIGNMIKNNFFSY